MSSPDTPEPLVDRRWLIVASAVWAATTFGHGLGLEAAAALFKWARQKETWLSEAGGAVGMRRLELLLAGFFLALAALGLALLGKKLRGLDLDRRALLREVAPWLAWALMVVIVWKAYIVLATELTHFAQYALVGALFALAFGKGRDPQLAFLTAAGLGVVDEVWQHYGLHPGDRYHWLDWSDPVLDALGAAGGVLPFVTFRRLRGDPLPDTWPRFTRLFVALSALLLPLLLLSPEAHAWLFGGYPSYHPSWQEFSNDKPVHWPAPGHGIPLVLGSLLVLGALVEPRRKGLSQTGLAVLLALIFIGFSPPSRKAGTPVHELVPWAQARRTPDPIVVDGTLEPAWERAEVLGPFLLNEDGRPARWSTRARVLWDDERIYFAFEVEDPDVWARATEHDDPDLPADECVEIFLDDGGDEVTYFEVEVSPSNVVQDLLCYVQAAPQDFNPDLPFQALNAWDARGLETATRVDGTLDQVEKFLDPERPPRLEVDRGWTAEVAIPWRAIAPYPENYHAHRPVPPRVGDRWRLGLYRIERPRPDPRGVGDLERRIGAEEARRLFPSPADHERALRERRLKPDAEGLVTANDALFEAAKGQRELQAWSPTWLGSFHKPRHFGALVFTD